MKRSAQIFVSLAILVFSTRGPGEGATRGTYDMASMSCVGAPTEVCSELNVEALPRRSECNGYEYALRNASLAKERALAAMYGTGSRSMFALASLQREGGSSPGSVCRRHMFSPAPMWVSSIEWSFDDTHLIIADLLAGALHFYTPGGINTNSVSSLKGSPSVAVKPTSLKSVASGYLLEDKEDNLLFLGPDLKILRSTPLSSKVEDSHARIRAIYQWAAWGNLLFAFGDVQRAGQYSSAFLRIDPSSPEKFTIVREMPIDSPSRIFYHLNLPYVASLGDKAYFLLLDSSPHIYRVNSSPVRLAAFPKGFGRPLVPAPSGPPSYREVFKAIERAKMPVGLYGWQGHLYVLLREPMGEQTQWSLVKIDPAKDRMVGEPIQLPTHAPHIVLAPGKRFWAIVEKGRLEAPGNQAILGLVLVPSVSIDKGRVSGECIR